VNLISRRRFIIWLASGLLVVVCLLITGWAWLTLRPEEPREAPEAEAVLQAQASIPYQILIPAYLPAGFQREQVDIQTGLAGPQGQAMAQLVYSHPRGVTLALYEWKPFETVAFDPGDSTGASVQMCSRMCRDHSQCRADRLLVDIGDLRVVGETSDPLILSPEHVRVILTTLAPAGGLLTYSTFEDVPLSTGLLPAEEVPANDSGVQELVLVVTPNGYTPVHFSVKKDVPVRLIFRQLGEVGCGNELYVKWGGNGSGYLQLSGQNDSQVLEFTPREMGEFLFHCPHFIFQGVMSVLD
jgi:hypothetical protein